MDKPIKTKLSNIARISSGHPFRGTIQQVQDAETHVIQVRDVDEFGEINLHSLITTELSGRKQPNYLQEGDILFVAKGAKHFSTYVQHIPKHTVCSPYFFIIQICPTEIDKSFGTILPEFISWQLNQLSAQRYFKNSAEGSLYVSIRRKVLEDTPITLPPIETQHRIVALHRAAINEQKVLKQLINIRQLQINAVANDILSNQT